MMAGHEWTQEQRDAADQARRELVEQLHRRLADGIATLDNGNEWQRYLAFAQSFHNYSFGNQILIMLHNADATAVAGYRAWQARGYQVRRGEQAIRILGPVTRCVPLTNKDGEPLLDEMGRQRHGQQIVGVKPVSVFDIAQVDGPPPPEAPRPVLLTGEAPPGLWDRLADLIEERGFRVERGDCHGANGLTNFGDRVVRVRADVDDAQSVKSLAHEAGHVLLSDPAGLSGLVECRGLREVEAESVAYMVTQAHGLDSGQCTFNYVTGWANQASGDLTPDQAVRTTSQRVIGAVHQILTRTQPATPPSPADAALDALEAEIDQRIGITGRPRQEPRPAPNRSVRAERAAAALTTRQDHGIAFGR
jgi:hypothetical protein